MRSRILCPALALTLLSAIPCLSLAAQAPVVVTQERDWVAFLGPYPRAGSEANHEDLAVLLWLQHTRTRAEVTRAEDEVMLRIGLFNAVMGVDLESDRYPLTQALLASVDRDLREVTGVLKDHFARPRPYEADARILPAVRLEHSFSYPSGHAARGAVDSGVLAALVPALREAILERGRQVGNDRAMVGIHYPSDVEAGQRFGSTLVAAWLQEPAHRRQADEARMAEWGTSMATANPSGKSR